MPTDPRWYGGKAPQPTQDILTAAIQSVMGGKVSPKDAMAEAKRKIDTEIGKAK